MLYLYETYNPDMGLLFKRKTGMHADHELHTHDALEISVLQKHSARYRLMHKEYIGKPGDVFIFRPFEPHWPLVMEDHQPFEWIMVLFSPFAARLIPQGYRMLTPFYTDRDVSPLIPAESPYARAIHASAEAAVRERERRQTGWEAMQLKYWIEIVIQINRYTEQELHARNTRTMSAEGLLESLAYMLQHFSEPVDAERLIRMSGMPRTVFYREFRQLTGVSPQVFLIRLRLQLAGHLIRHTRRKIVDIAGECGFNSLSNFNEQFKIMYGVSPRSHRQAGGGTP